MRFCLPIVRADRRENVYEISARSTLNTVSARETVPLRLPAFCPDRHINYDATFCMGWRGAESLDVVDQASAQRWWETLVQFLRLQERAARLRRWPSARQWAHGDAAKYQQQAIIAAEQLGPDFSKDIEQGQIRAVYKKIGTHPVLRVFRDTVWTYSVRLDQRKVINLRQRCVCPKGQERRPRVLRSCGVHAQAAADLAVALHEQALAEKAFWESMKSKPCCKTLEHCPLA